MGTMHTNKTEQGQFSYHNGHVPPSGIIFTLNSYLIPTLNFDHWIQCAKGLQIEVIVLIELNPWQLLVTPEVSGLYFFGYYLERLD